MLRYVIIISGLMIRCATRQGYGGFPSIKVPITSLLGASIVPIRLYAITIL